MGQAGAYLSAFSPVSFSYRPALAPQEQGGRRPGEGTVRPGGGM
jgi:hypothetical protein